MTLTYRRDYKLSKNSLAAMDTVKHILIVDDGFKPSKCVL